MAQASKATEQVGKGAEDAAKSADTAMGRMVKSAQNNRQAWSTAGTALTGFGAAILGLGAMAAKTGIAYNQLQQRAGSALEVLMGSAEAAAVQMAKLNEFADTSPFSREIFIEAQQQLIAFGIEADRVVPILGAVQDAVAATGGSNADIAELVNIIAKVGSTGKITAQNLNELGYRGVDAATIIGEQMGKTGQQIREEITAGTLDADAALQALTDGMTEKFGGAAAGMKETFDGALDRVRAAWRDLSAELMTPLVSPDGGGLLIDLANTLADFMRSVESMPAPVRNAATALAGLTGAASLGAGAFLLLLPRALDTIDAFRTMADTFPRVASGLSSVGKGAAKLGLVVGAAAGATIAVQKLTDAIRGIDRASFEVGTNELVASLIEAERSGDAFNSTLGDLNESGVLNKQMFSDLGATITEVSDINWFQNLIGPLAATGINEAKDRLADLGGAFAQLASSDLPQAQSAFKQFYAEAEAGGATFSEVLETMPAFKDALVGIALEAGYATDDVTLLRIATGEITPEMVAAAGAADEFENGIGGAAEAAAAAADATEEYYNALRDLANEFITAERAAMDYADSLEETAEAAAENGKAWEDGTEAADANKRALLDLAEQALATADSLSAEGKSGTFLQQAREDLIDVATEMTGSRELAEAYVDQLLGTPEEIKTIVDLETEQAKADWAALWDEIGYHPPLVIDPEVDPEGKVPQFTGLVGEIPLETNTDVGVETDEAVQEMYGFGEVVEGATEDQTVTVDGDVQPAWNEMNLLEAAINDAGGTVTINGDSVPGDQVLDTLMGIINSSDGTVTINGMPVPAEEALMQAIRLINSSGGTVEIDGDNSGANSATDSAVGHANSSSGTIGVNANTSAANSAINNAARTRYSTIQVTWRQTNSRPSTRQSSNYATFATGGSVYGPGTGTSDSIPALLSNGEHVITAKEVAMAGGQDAIYRMREAIRSGFKFANGGAVERTGYAASHSMAPAPRVQTQSVSASVDSGVIASAVRAGFESATVIAQVSDRVAANLYQRGASASRAFGGSR